MSPKQHVADLMFPHGRFRGRALIAIIRGQWFIRLRWMFLIAASALLILDRIRLPEFERPWAVTVCIGLIGVVNIIWWLAGRHLLKEVYRGAGPSAENLSRGVSFLNAQMTVDLLLLTGILRFSGGIENPMAIFYLFHMLISALLLRPLNAALQGCWALFLYGGLAIGECSGFITPHYPFLNGTAELGVHSDWSYVFAAIGALGAGIFGTLFFTLQISSRLDEQERELFEANRALEQSQEALQELQARRSRFMQTAAHQLKSPLTGIEMLADLIRNGVVDSDGIQDVVRRIIKRCQEAIVQVTELLTLARIGDAAPTRHENASTDPRAVVEKVVARFTDQAQAKDIKLEVNFRQVAGARVRVEEGDLADCVSNLLDNAIKYTADGGSVSVTTSSTPQHVSISVKDTGMGIAEEQVDSVFDPFRRGNLALAANIPGSGLGLAIVREVVEQAHGNVDVRSTVGKGSEFTLSFPRQDATGSRQRVRRIRATTLTSEAASDDADRT
jgi:signal transduction histidine kinase